MAVLPPDPVYCLRSNIGYIHCLCFPNKNSAEWTSSLIAGSESGILQFWDLETNRVQYQQEMAQSIQAIHSVEDKIITQEKNGCIKLWNLNNGTNYDLQGKYESYGGFCRCIFLEKTLIVPQENGLVDIVEINNMEKIRSLIPEKEHLGSIMCLESVEISGNFYILGGYETGDVILWDYNTGKACGHLKLPQYITSVTFDPISGRGICGNASTNLEVFFITKNFNIIPKAQLSIVNAGCNTVKLRPDRKILVSGGWDAKIRLFSWRSLRLLAVLSEHKKAVTDIQFTPKKVKLWNSNIMAASDGDGVISLWNLYN